ncbi:nucleotidyltransferase family protein [Paucihalobacter ruber]|uniref:Nucleotidyltransferase family protein n=2 Tax=Paucihalobacter ruber TaxID=2567861 RepID=A0A506PPG1_9FLAO|nr:nucleotidyltransferase family protein [Paucihalobacter ruber]
MIPMKRQKLSTYKLIGQIISFSGTKETLVQQLKDYQNWEALVYYGSQHLLLPTIYKRLKDLQILHLLPDDLVAYLEEIHQINHNRNLLLLQQIKQLHGVLSEAHVNHLFLKGAAFLIKGAHSNNLERMVGDIDILVDVSQAQKAFELLKENGYDQQIGFNYEVKNYRHLNRQISKAGLAAVELHGDLLKHPKQYLIKAKEMLETQVLCNHLPIPNNYFMGLHSVLALQINDLGYYYKTVSLKTLNDTLVLGIAQQPQLIQNLQSHKYGRLFLAYAQQFSRDFSVLKLSKWQQFQGLWLSFKLRLPLYSYLVHRLKSALWFLFNRLYLWLTNSSYRKNLLKNKFKQPHN